MSTIDAKYIDKSTWGDGPWMTEPDRKEWKDTATGLPCLAVRVDHHGSWCGYVGVAPDHPAYGLSYDGIPGEEAKARRAASRKAMLDAKGDFENVQWPERREPDEVGQKVCEIEVHGGLTYADACSEHICHVPEPGEPDNVWWFGFDTAHAWDYSPAMAAREREHGFDRVRFRSEDVYRDLTYIEDQCQRLASQLAALR